MSAQDDFEQVAAVLADRGVTVAKVFGKPAYKNLDGKAFACLFQDALACRLIAGTPEHDEALALPGAELFDPSSRHRPMKDWVSVPHVNADRWLHFAEVAHDRKH